MAHKVLLFSLSSSDVWVPFCIIEFYIFLHKFFPPFYIFLKSFKIFSLLFLRSSSNTLRVDAMDYSCVIKSSDLIKNACWCRHNWILRKVRFWRLKVAFKMFSLQSHKMRLKRMGTDILMHRGLLESHESTDANGNHRQGDELMGLKLRKEIERWIEQVNEARYQHVSPKFPLVKRKSMTANTYRRLVSQTQTFRTTNSQQFVSPILSNRSHLYVTLYEEYVTPMLSTSSRLPCFSHSNPKTQQRYYSAICPCAHGDANMNV